MGCCVNKVDTKDEDFTRDIISDLKISTINYKDLRENLFTYMKKKKVIEKKRIEDKLEEIFYENDKNLNPNLLIHKQIFQEIFFLFNENVKLYEILLFLYPLLNKINKEEHNEFIEILVNYFDSDYFSYEDLHKIILKLFQFSTQKITEIVESQLSDTKIKNNLKAINNYYFCIAKIHKKVNHFLNKYVTEEKDKQMKNIYCADFKNYCKSKNIYSCIQIRNYFFTDNDE